MQGQSFQSLNTEQQQVTRTVCCFIITNSKNSRFFCLISKLNFRFGFKQKFCFNFVFPLALRSINCNSFFPEISFNQLNPIEFLWQTKGSLERRETYKYFLYIFYKSGTKEGPYLRPQCLPIKSSRV